MEGRSLFLAWSLKAIHLLQTTVIALIILKYSTSFYVARIVLLSHMSDVCWRRTSRQGGAGNARDGGQVQQNTYILQVKAHYISDYV